jgi:hypothetical protein
MPKFLEDKLKAEYGADSAIPYKVMNKLGAMHGNKETAKGRRMDAKHAQDMAGQHPHRNLGSYLHKPKRKRDTESSIAGKSR